MEITSFKSIVNNYQTIFFDAFGVLKNHQGLLPGIEKTFDYLGERGIDYFIITNDASRGPEELALDYQRRGLKQITKSKIVSSGMLAREYLKYKVKSGLIAYLGTAQSAHYIETLGLKAVSIADLDLEQAEEVSALVFLDDEGFDWYSDINKAVNLLRMVNIPVIVSNTDKSYPVSRKQVAIAAGGIANMVQDIVGKKFIKFGKPDAQMFIFAYEHSVKKGAVQDKEKILMVGDTLTTDILGGNKFGLDTVLVLTGNTLEKHADTRISASGIIPTYICDSAVID
ncbi:HAD-IIA family hydrolase [Marinoscillum furvescens]|uniref:HAD superfamily hydrolase (TIGR01459 family) n=1 Tax=Marinoscillum furvescens DSM 4134 TaxID=1122208 RepID=A0A3D9L1S9_MARFU|nr:HAD-IIA family hydrolase [Marinoscillum furvescens]RED98018.1 HAD superfamily hydrolase (TIGR01459 family) [Marinoscillum furvescens DSM 4134]